METEEHWKQMTLLRLSLEHAWKDRQDYYVGGNMFVYYKLEQATRNTFRGPDVFVVLDTVKRVRKSWVCWQEGRTPNVVIELLSASTEHVDRGEKMQIYARDLHVGEYYLYDPLSPGVLEGYELDPVKREYRRITPEPGGDLPCRQLGLRLGVRHGTFMCVTMDWLRWIDEQGNVLSGPDEQVQAAWEQARAVEEQARTAEQQARTAEQQARTAEQQARTAEQQARALAERLAAYEKRFGPLPE